MADALVEKMASVLINYSLDIKPREKLLIVTTISGLPLARAAYREALKAGALVSYYFEDETLASTLINEGNEEQIGYIPDIYRYAHEIHDARLHITANDNLYNLSNIDAKRLALRQQALMPVRKLTMQRTGKDLRWCVTRFPTNGYANAAHMSLADYERFVYKACMLDQDDPVAAWRKQEARQQEVIDYLSQHDEIHILAPGTDLTYRTKGHRWINARGDYNFPDGEVFTGPIEDSVNGIVSFTYPAIYQQTTVENVKLTFKDGKVVEASASRGEEFLYAMLDLDEGSRFVGEVAIGMNYNVDRFSEDILFDEKIGGTMHMALGAAYPETGCKNVSGLHWDMICDLRAGKILADGELFYENGNFLI